MKTEKSDNFPFTLTKNPNSSYHSIVASRPIPANTLICKFSYRKRLSAPNRYTVQLSEKEHILLEPTFLQYINHSCKPNIFFDTLKMELHSIEALNEGEEVRYFYPATEWEMEESFLCNCGHINCLKEVKGAAYLTKEQFEKVQLNKFIRDKYLIQKT
jgi:hypothetical protein